MRDRAWQHSDSKQSVMILKVPSKHESSVRNLHHRKRLPQSHDLRNRSQLLDGKLKLIKRRFALEKAGELFKAIDADFEEARASVGAVTRGTHGLRGRT